ncbi:flagellar hook assembly protein FlgD [Aquisalimonas asiatica]|uniref:Basal-body rod modification protein FlgD n=1 Tax=Aquisalimonas asiatica TaxID=406100 RepID=A0A1H8UK45_9GAMM|nr:flagellar hook assembly protein FlgD [Aquisalimonas asiatica]SEP03387.1 flagellar basal-body rod modification protein FlgD [Aquisalimonas asiatica]
MLGLDALTGSTSSSSEIEQPEDAKGKTADELDSSDFLQLMIAQFQNQDPFEPMENGEFMGQLAQFTSASGISGMQESFEEFAAQMGQDQALQAASLVGRSVMVESDSMPLGENGLSGVAQLPRNSENLNITISDGAGQTVREISMGRQDAGDVPFHWDGLNNDGDEMPDGTYTVRASIGSGDDSTAVNTLAAAPVTSVSLESDGRSPMLTLEGAGEYSLDSIRHIQ